MSESCSGMSDSLWPHELYSPWNSPGQNTEVSSLSLLHGIFETQGLNPGLPHCRQIFYKLSHKESPYMYIDMYICTCVYINTCTHIHIIYIYTHTHIYLYIYIYKKHIGGKYIWILISHKERMSFATTWIIEIIILCEVSQTKTNIIWYHLYMESLKKDTNELICKTEIK